MGAYRDKRSRRWRYRKWLTLPDGRRERITGTPAIDTKKAAEHAESMHVLRVMNPGTVFETTESAVPESPEPKEVPTIREYSKVFLETYVPTLEKPSARRAVKQILSAYVLPAFGETRLDRIRQEHVDAFVTAQKKPTKKRKRGLATKTINNRLSALSSLIKYAVSNGVIATPSPPLKCKIDGMTSEVVAVPLEDVEKLPSTRQRMIGFEWLCYSRPKRGSAPGRSAGSSGRTCVTGC